MINKWGNNYACEAFGGTEPSKFILIISCLQNTYIQALSHYSLAVSSDVNHDHVLIILPCRLLKKLKKKNEQQIELEKKEQGFSIYVNGANVELGRAYSRAKSRHSKTAGGEMFYCVTK